MSCVLDGLGGWRSWSPPNPQAIQLCDVVRTTWLALAGPGCGGLCLLQKGTSYRSLTPVAVWMSGCLAGQTQQGMVWRTVSVRIVSPSQVTQAIQVAPFFPIP